MQSLSNTESFQNGKCEVCSIKMSTDAKGWQKICIVCVYPKGVMRVDLEREIGAKIKKDITMRPLRIGIIMHLSICIHICQCHWKPMHLTLSHPLPQPASGYGYKNLS